MNSILNPSYSESIALIIGINAYKNASPLLYAKSDAEAVATILKDRFDFEDKNISVLLDEEATRDNIRYEYLSYATSGLDVDSRLVVYFAGHGHTVPSRRGEVGFLVPYDGDPNDLSSLVRWDDLTKGADLIHSKHILFLMDACYSGLAITRALKPGTTRFLKDMMLRFARQVITAGKANELVSDEGGPIPDHSIFTGHLLLALEGSAADQEGVLTANGLMVYVYQAVGRDPNSHQTPHFGYVEGDGDLVFSAPILSKLQDSEKEDRDVLFAVPVPSLPVEEANDMTIEDRTKKLLSDPSSRIQLHGLIVEKTREAIAMTDEEAFPTSSSWDIEEFTSRLEQLEEKTNDLTTICALLGYWASEDHRDILTLPARRFAGRIKLGSGLNVWIALRWYPVFLMAYSLGLAAVASSNYGNLLQFFSVPISEAPSRNQDEPLIVALVSGVGDLSNAFGELPGHENQHVPRSEYIYKRLQPKLDDLFFLGNDYEQFFDRFELLFSLEHAHQRAKRGGNLLGPIGRFGWKHARGYGCPLTNLVEEANAAGDKWKPLQAGFFDRSYQRFEETANALVERLIMHPLF